MFTSELELSSAFKEILPNSEWAESQCIEEVKGISGIPDYILIRETENNNIAVGIELKLKNWKRAMRQAFRYRAFCEQSYVIIDNARIKPALKSIEDFINFNVGLASIDIHSKSLEIHYKPKIEEPFSLNLKNKLHKIFLDKKD